MGEGRSEGAGHPSSQAARRGVHQAHDRPPRPQPCAGSMSMNSAACKIAIPSAPPSSSEWLCPSLCGVCWRGLLFAEVHSVSTC